MRAVVNIASTKNQQLRGQKASIFAEYCNLIWRIENRRRIVEKYVSPAPFPPIPATSRHLPPL
jgi:hypothetical protein